MGNDFGALDLTDKQMENCFGDLDFKALGFMNLDSEDAICGHGSDGDHYYGQWIIGDSGRERYCWHMRKRNPKSAWSGMIVLTMEPNKISTARMYIISEELISRMQDRKNPVQLANPEDRRVLVIFLTRIHLYSVRRGSLRKTD